MSCCDLCSVPLTESKNTYSAPEFRVLVRSGLRPPSRMFSLAMVFGTSRQEAEAEWVSRVVSDSTSWMLCSECQRRATDYIGELMNRAEHRVALKTLDCARIAAVIDDDAGFHLRRACCQEHMGDYNAALETLRAAAKRWKDNGQLDEAIAKVSSKWQRAQDEQRKQVIEEAARQEEARTASVRAERKRRKQCELCGVHLGLVDRLLSRSQHKHCSAYRG